MGRKIGYFLGSVFAFVGAALYFSTKDVGVRYSFRGIDNSAVIANNIGIFLLVIGGAILLLLLISQFYKSKTIKSNTVEDQFKVCPKCMCKSTRDTEYCPNCHEKLT